MRDLDRPQVHLERCPDCNDCWLDGYHTCRSCRLPLRMPARELGLGQPRWASASDADGYVDSTLTGGSRLVARLVSGWQILIGNERPAYDAS